MECRHCGSKDVEFEEVIIPLVDHGGRPMRGAFQVMCNCCQAEYTESNKGTLISAYQTPMGGVAEIVIFTDIPLDELKAIFKEMKLWNEGDEE